MKISIIHPSRSRPKQAIATKARWLINADHASNIEYVFSLDLDDPQRNAYKGNKLLNSNTSAIAAINYAAYYATGDLLIVVSDDFDCVKGWDAKLLEAIGDRRDFLVKTPDGIQEWIVTLPILDRKYYERFGYVYPPHLKHMFADTWMTHVADLLGRRIEVDLLFEHKHYSIGKSKKDKVNARADNTWKDGEKKYLDGVRCNFGLPDSEIKGELKCPESFKRWLDKKL